MSATSKPSPHDLWVQAGGGTGAYSAERYRELMHDHGALLRPGDDGYEQASRALPCGWPGPSRQPMTCKWCLWDISVAEHGRWRLAWTDTDDGSPDPYHCTGRADGVHVPKKATA